MRKIYYFIAFILLLNACATAPVEKTPLREEKPLTVEEQEDRSLDVFNEILDISISSSDRSKALPKMEKKYFEIIDKYPEAPLAHESHMKLIEIYLNDYSPPDFDKAAMIYGKFTNRYPKSVLRAYVEDTIAKKYNKYAEWGRLLSFTAPILDEYALDSGRARPSLIYLNAEANYHLDNLGIAEKGYKRVMELFPDVSESSWAGKRLIEIGEKMK